MSLPRAPQGDPLRAGRAYGDLDAQYNIVSITNGG
jgi:hypothetical protein